MKVHIPRLALALLFSVTLHAVAITHYVDLNSPAPTPPYTTWPTAATNIQDAIVAASAGDLVLVTNGVYQTGGVTTGALLLTNRVAVTKPIVVQSVNGPLETIIKGYQVTVTTNGNSAVRCVYLTNGASLVGFTLTEGATRTTGNLDAEASGGGIWCVSTNASISNCIITANASGYSGGGVVSGTLVDCVISNNFSLVGRGWGAGAYNSTLNRCRLTGNVANNSGGGAYGCILKRCLVLNNTSAIGGGAYEGTADNCLFLGNFSSQQGGGALDTVLTSCTVVSNTSATTGGGYYSPISVIQNCIVYYNTAPSSPNLSAKYNYCCTAPTVLNGSHSITNAPMFGDPVNGDFRLQSNSPCINAGNNTYVTSNVDLEGQPRFVGGMVDMGAYEMQSPAFRIPSVWLQTYGFPTDGSADFLDADSDGMSNWAEWFADTNPTNALSRLRMVSSTNVASGVQVKWESVITRSYKLERSTDFSSFQTIATRIAGTIGTRTFTDTTATNGGPYFHRVAVE